MTYGLRAMNGALNGYGDLKICEQVWNMMLISAYLINITDY